MKKGYICKDCNHLYEEHNFKGRMICKCIVSGCNCKMYLLEVYFDKVLTTLPRERCICPPHGNRKCKECTCSGVIQK